MANGIGNIFDRIFTQKLIVKKMPGDRLKTIDFDKLQSISYTSRGQYKGVHRSRHGQQQLLFSARQNVEMVDGIRRSNYNDYELMDTDSIIHAALDIYADESTVRNEHGNLLSIDCEDHQKKAILNNLYFDILNVEFNLWYWIRSMAKYGDYFLYTPTVPSVGIVDAIPIHPMSIRRNDFYGEDGDETVFEFEGENMYMSNRDRKVYKYHEIAHFRFLSDSNYLPYGRSMLEGGRQTWKKLVLLEDAMLIHRIMRAPERRIFKIDVGNIPPDAIDAYMEKISSEMKKVPYLDENGDYNLRFNLQNMLEDYFLPTRGGESTTDIDTLSGMDNPGAIEDIEYQQQKLLSFLRIPKSYLGFDADVEGKSVLAAEDIKFANLISRIQKIIESELEKMGFVHLLHQGYSPEDAAEFRLELSRPSIIYERQKIELLDEKANLANTLIESKLFSRSWVYENIYNMTKEEWTNQRNLVITDLQEKFREDQIENEGNDPKESGRSFGTPHDIISLQLASKMGSNEEAELSSDVKSIFKNDKRHENPGRPEEPGSFATDDDTFGRDPLGRKSLTPNFNKRSALESFLKDSKKKVNILTEKEDTKTINDLDVLNENKILDTD